jgi:gluconate/galactonate dehydratase
MQISGLATAVVEGNFDWTYVRLYTDEGLTGTGECYLAPGLTAICRELTPILLGEDPRDVDRLFRKLQWSTSGAGSVSGIVYNAISGIEAALWDLTGKATGLPIYRLLGGKFRSRVRMYADCHAGEALEALTAVMYTRAPSWLSEAERKHHVSRSYWAPGGSDAPTAEDYALRARQMAALGYSALKFDLDVPNPHQVDAHNQGISNREVDYMIGLVRAVREAVGDGIDLAFDCHWRYTVADVLKVAYGVEPYHLLWLEDPTPPENVEALLRVTRATRTPICTGENLQLRHGFRELLESGAAHVISPDLQKCGGLLEGKRIAELADLYHIPVAPHNISSPLGTIAAAHVCAAIPNFLALEFHAHDVPFWQELAAGHAGPIIDQGYITVPDRPGLGIELNEEVARRYARPGEPFFAHESN